MITSPVTGGNVRLVKKLPSRTIIVKYQKSYGIDVSRLFEKEDVEILECIDTGYKFFYPLSVQGDERFYLELYTYYLKETGNYSFDKIRWEHLQSLNYFPKEGKMLEVGCGDGSFLEYVNTHTKLDVSGVEPNDAAKTGRKIEDKIYQVPIYEFSEAHPEQYDCVCIHQVLEHISDIKGFLSAVLNSLTENGTLIVSVPNNGSFIKHDKRNLLNMPPHHVGLWEEISLRNIAEAFSLEVVDVKKEPLQNFHVSWYVDTIEQRFFQKGFLSKVYSLLKLRKAATFLVKKLRYFITGHAILVVYKKASPK